MVKHNTDGWSLCCDCGKNLFVRYQDDDDHRCYSCERLANPPKPARPLPLDPFNRPGEIRLGR